MAARICLVELPAEGAAPTERFYAAAFGFEMTGVGPSWARTMIGAVDLGLQADRAGATWAPLAEI